MRPNSSKVKKVLNWNSTTQKFVMEQKHLDELTALYPNWHEFMDELDKLQSRDHPQVKKPSYCKAAICYSIATVLLLLFMYVFFIILQLALFNLIMLVVMVVWWWKLLKICFAVIGRILDNGRKSAFKSHIKKMKASIGWLATSNIDIQENDEGKWIEIHLNDGADKDDDGIEEEDED